MHKHSSSFLLIASLLVGCAHRKDLTSAPVKSPDANARTPSALTRPAETTNLLITTFGEHSTGGSWKVRVPEEERTVEVAWQGSSQVPSKWRAQAGWFVFVENERRLWAYDGDRDLLLFEFTPSAKGGVYSVSGPTNFGCLVPQMVLRRLSDDARKAIKPNG